MAPWNSNSCSLETPASTLMTLEAALGGWISHQRDSVPYGSPDTPWGGAHVGGGGEQSQEEPCIILDRQNDFALERS